MIKEVKALLKSFKHCGWVNGLSEKQYEALNDLQAVIDKFDAPEDYRLEQRATAKLLRDEGLTIREIAKLLGYKNPGSITHLLSKI